MRLPGFTAETSLYEMSERYHMTGSGNGPEPNSVLPAFTFPHLHLSCYWVPRWTCGLCDPNTGACPPCFLIYDFVCPVQPPR